jgi:hypothetical protein
MVDFQFTTTIFRIPNLTKVRVYLLDKMKWQIYIFKIYLPNRYGSSLIEAMVAPSLLQIPRFLFLIFDFLIFGHRN